MARTASSSISPSAPPRPSREDVLPTHGLALRRALARVFEHRIDQLADGVELGDACLGDVRIEQSLERDHQFHALHRIESEIEFQVGCRRDLLGVFPCGLADECERGRKLRAGHPGRVFF